jgi:ABC-type multidrug transport system ATPase subunit
MSNVTFTYPYAATPALANVSLDLVAGQVSALVGLNGSGKTTLAKVLAGLLQPTAGTVSWNGTDITMLDRAALRQRIAVLFQDYVRFYFRVRENIVFGNAQLHDEALMDQAASQSGSNEFIAQLADAVDTELGNTFVPGAGLSGGQWQRLVLARILYRRADLVILDEPTAALDPLAEAEFFERIRLLFPDAAILLISHRVTSVTSADRIYVLDSGRIAEAGNHTGLMQQGGQYASLYKRQAASILAAPNWTSLTLGGWDMTDAEELVARLTADISARERWQASWADAVPEAVGHRALDEVRRVSRDNAAWLSELLKRTGWPLRSVVGAEAAEAAWAIAQHADHDQVLQARCLEAMRAAASVGEASTSRLAYLEDRVRIAHGRPQLYGTQEIQLPGRDWELFPVEDPGRLNERRMAVGLPELPTVSSLPCDQAGRGGRAASDVPSA